MQDIEERRITRPDDPVAVNVRVWRAPLTRNRIDALDVLATQAIEHFAHQADALVFAYAGTQKGVQLVVRRVDHRTGLSQQRDLVDGLDAPRLEEHLLTVNDGEPLLLERGQDRHLDHIDADRFGGQPVLVHDRCHLAGYLLSDPGVRMKGAPQCGDPGAGPGSS